MPDSNDIASSRVRLSRCSMMTSGGSVVTDAAIGVSLLTASGTDAASRRSAARDFSSLDVDVCRKTMRALSSRAGFLPPRRAAAVAEIACTKFPDEDAVHLVCSALAALHLSVPPEMPAEYVSDLVPDMLADEKTNAAKTTREIDGGPSRRRLLLRLNPASYSAVLQRISQPNDAEVILDVCLRFAEDCLSKLVASKADGHRRRFFLRRAHAALQLASSLSPQGTWTSRRFVDLTTRLALGGGRSPLCTLSSGVPREVLARSVAAPVEKALLREKDRVLPTIPGLVYALQNTDLSDCVWKPFCRTAVDAVQNSSAFDRQCGILIAAVLAARVREKVSSGLMEGVDSFGKLLKTAKYANQRVCAGKALARMCESVPEVASEKLPIAALKHICVWICAKKETNDDYRSEAARCLLDALQAVLRRKKTSVSCSPSLLENEHVKNALNLLVDMVRRKRAEAERRSVLLYLANPETDLYSLLNGDSEEELCLLDATVSAAMDIGSSGKVQDAFRASTVVSRFLVRKQACSDSAKEKSNLANGAIMLITKFEVIAYDVDKSSIMQNAKNCHLHSASQDALLLITACKCLLLARYMKILDQDGDKSRFAAIETFDPQVDPACDVLITCLIQCALEARKEISRVALSAIKDVRRLGGAHAACEMFYVLWVRFLSDSKAAQDFMSERPRAVDCAPVERNILRDILAACLIPSIPAAIAGYVVLAAHHPRVFDVDMLGFRPSASRCWNMLLHALPDQSGGNALKNSSEHREVNTAEAEAPWIDFALQLCTGCSGLASGEETLIESAIGALGGLLRLLHTTYPKEIGHRSFSRVLDMLKPLSESSSSLSEEHLKALESVHSDYSVPMNQQEEASRGQSGSAQRKQIQSASSTAGSKSAAKTRAKDAKSAANADKLKNLAQEAKSACSKTSSALRALCYVCTVTPEFARASTAQILPLIPSCIHHERAQRDCRLILSALASAAERPLCERFATIASILYGIEAEEDAHDALSDLVQWLADRCDPPLSADGFVLIAPIVKEAMKRQPREVFPKSRTSAARAETAEARREDIALARAAASVLNAHCKPIAVDAAVAAAGARAGDWALTVLEREDAAFGKAAEALASLCGTALDPSSMLLSQVLAGIVSGKSSVREASLSALEQMPALSQPNVACPRNAVLGRTLWLAINDPDEENARLGCDLWDNYAHPLDTLNDAVALLNLLAHAEKDVRIMAANAIAGCVGGVQNTKARNSIIPQTFTLYLKNLSKLYGGLAPEPEADPKSSVPKQRRHPRGSESEKEIVDKGWCARHGTALVLRALSSSGSLSNTDIPIVFAFLSSKGLGDVNDDVRAEMAAAAVAVAEAAGEKLGPSSLLPMIDKQLNTRTAAGSDVAAELVSHADRTRENLVMCLGVVASHLPPSDRRKIDIADQVIRTAVETPSELVQNAAARCLVPLATVYASDDAKLKKLRDMLSGAVWDSQASYGQRRGSAYALAGLMRGLGIKCLKRMSLIEQIQTAAADKINPRKRHGAFLCVETLAIMFGRLFEPYLILLLPVMLSSMGDNALEVREACWAAARASMADLSSLGVKMILPSLLKGLDDRQWRTKAGSAEVLGAMAFCAPRQLAQCLPQIVPKLAGALADAHPKVVAGAESAIGRIAAVVRNPEVRNLSKFLLAALRDPANSTRGALDAMLGTEFAHAVDPASLALLVPPLHRGLRERATDLKVRAAAIVGSMCSHVANSEDVVPYLDLLLPDLRATLLDAIPTVRRTSAKALGALTAALGEDGLPGIVPWLMAALLSAPARNSGTSARSAASSSSVVLESAERELVAVSVSSSAERSGAAMGLAEVCGSLDDARIADILRRVLMSRQTSTNAREGGLMLLAALPRALGPRFEEKLPIALSSILQGLADDSDNVREAALDAGRKTVSAYALTSLETLLPEILAAMRDKLWRIRCAATQLLGDLLLAVAGAMVNSEKDAENGSDDIRVGEDDNLSDTGDDGESNAARDEQVYDSPETMAAALSVESTMKAIEEKLGSQRRNEVLAALYIVRCDVSVRVRQIGMQVWKSVVANTPRVLREIMPFAINQIVSSLSDEDVERRVAAGKALGDLSHKLGDRVVPDVLPALHAGITNKVADSRVRLGACEGLAELVLSCPREQLEVHANVLLMAVRDGLCDPNPQVRRCAGGIFATLLHSLRTVAVDKVVPHLIGLISSSPDPITSLPSSASDPQIEVSEAARNAGFALEGLKVILRACGTHLMSIVVPDLVATVPLNASSCRALAAAVSVLGADFELFLSEVADALIASAEKRAHELITSPSTAFDEVVAAIIRCGEGISSDFLEKVLYGFNDVKPCTRLAAGVLCVSISKHGDMNVLSANCVQMLEALIRQLTDSDADVVRVVWEALQFLTSRMSSGARSTHVCVIRHALRLSASDFRVGDPSTSITGLSIPKGPSPFVLVYADTLLHASPALREQAALAISELTELCDAKTLSPFAIKLMGCLIRVMSDHPPWPVKAAILRAMLMLLKRTPGQLRAFGPQMQSTFLKCLADTKRLVRARACAAIAAFAPIQPRLELLLQEMANLGCNGAFEGARAAGFFGCSRAFQNAARLPANAFSGILDLLIEGLRDEDNSVGLRASGAIGDLAHRVTDAAQFSGICDSLLAEEQSDSFDFTMKVRLLRTVGLVLRGMTNAPFLQLENFAGLEEFTLSLLRSTTPPVLSAACVASVDLYRLYDSTQFQRLTQRQRKHILSSLSDPMRVSSAVEVRVAILNSLADIIRNRVEVIESVSDSILICAGDSNGLVRNAADSVIRRAFVAHGGGFVNESALAVAKSTLSQEDKEFLDRRVDRAIELPATDDEADEDDE